MTCIQNYLNDIFGIDSNTSATIIITIIVFVTGILSAELIKAISRYRSRNTIRQIFQFSVQAFSKQAIKQAKAYKQTSQEFSFKSEMNFEIKSGAINQVSKIGIGYKDSYEAYFIGIENFSFKKKENYKDLRLLVNYGKPYTQLNIGMKSHLVTLTIFFQNILNLMTRGTEPLKSIEN